MVVVKLGEIAQLYREIQEKLFRVRTAHTVVVDERGDEGRRYVLIVSVDVARLFHDYEPVVEMTVFLNIDRDEYVRKDVSISWYDLKAFLVDKQVIATRDYVLLFYEDEFTKRLVPMIWVPVRDRLVRAKLTNEIISDLKAVCENLEKIAELKNVASRIASAIFDIKDTDIYRKIKELEAQCSRAHRRRKKEYIEIATLSFSLCRECLAKARPLIEQLLNTEINLDLDLNRVRDLLTQLST